MTKKKQPASNGEPETKEQAFLRLANARVNKAIKALEMVGNLHSYKPAEAHTSKIGLALQNAVKRTLIRLAGGQAGGFTLEG